MKPKTVFMNYRRRDTAPYAIAIRNEIEDGLTSTRVFLDVSRLRPSVRWPESLQNELREASIVLILIGQNWLLAPGSAEAPRLFEREDWVHEEIRLAMTSKPRDAIIPVLIDDVQMPEKSQLPDDIAELAEIQSLRIRTDAWDDGMVALLALCAERLGNVLRAENIEYPRPNPIKAGTDPLSEKRLANLLADSDFSDWSVDTVVNKDSFESWLVRTFRFRSFAKAMAFMREAATFCDTVNHHPRWQNIYRTVRVHLSTWDAGHQITERDVELAMKMNLLFRSLSKSGSQPDSA